MTQNPEDIDGMQTPDSDIVARKDAALRAILDSDARARLANIRLVKPELAASVETYLLELASQGKAPSQITDSQLKQILVSIQQPRRNFKFNRV